MPIVIRQIIIRGRVQGVGYRAWTEYTAEGRGLDGWVRNRRDGSVEALFAGEPRMVREMIDLCHQGPPGSRVDAIEEREASSEELEMRGGYRFAVLATA
ncbi:MAG: acylphosphatase [Pseudorhodoplanes sp.]|nr:acylphosphatase [Pseudorhodoplanes sp.]